VPSGAHLRKPAIGCAEAAAAERIVAAGVEDHQVEASAGPLHLPQHQVDVDHLEIDVGFARRIGVDGDEIVGAGHLHPMPGVIEQRDVGTLNLLAERLYGTVERRLFEVELGAAANQREAERAKRFGHQGGIVLRIIEPGDVLIR
jgi:hypothetical protein